MKECVPSGAHSFFAFRLDFTEPALSQPPLNDAED